MFYSFQAKLAIANLIEMIGLVETLLDNVEGPEDQIYALHRGWAERMSAIRVWCGQQAEEMVIFGQAFDTDTPFGPRPEDAD